MRAALCIADGTICRVLQQHLQSFRAMTDAIYRPAPARQVPAYPLFRTRAVESYQNGDGPGSVLKAC